MTVTVDTNVLVHASNSDSPEHRPANDLLRRLAHGHGLVTLFWPVLLGYVRIATSPRVLPRPLSAHEAASNVEELLARPHIRAVGEGDGFWKVYRKVADPAAVRENLVSDAHIVALMHQHGVREIWTHDRDFRKFDGIVVRDPYAR
jgi:uncharacterized protein